MKQIKQADGWTAVRGGAAAAFLAALIYLLTLSRHYTADSLINALVIEKPTLQTMVDPTHLLLHPLGLIWYRLWLALGWNGRSLLSLQLLNGLAGAICVGLMWVMAYKLSGTIRRATIIALGFAVSGGFWLLSVEAEFVTLPLAVQLLALSLILGVSAHTAGRIWYALLLGVVVSAAILTYLTSSFLILVALVGFMTAGLEPRIKWQQIGLFLGSLLLLTIPIFWGTLFIWTGGDWDQLEILGGQGHYGILHWFNLPNGLYAFLRTLGLYPGLVMNDSTRQMLAMSGSEERLLFFAYYGLLALAALLPVLCLIKDRHQLWVRAKRPILVLLTWTIAFAVFGFYWVPGDITFWVPLLAAWWLTVAICWSLTRRSIYWAAAISGILLLALINSTQVILPRTDLETNEAYQAAMRIGEETGEDDLLLGDPNDFTLLSIVYFAGRRALPLQRSVATIGELEEWIAAEAEIAKGKGGRVLILDKDGSLQEIR